MARMKTEHHSAEVASALIVLGLAFTLGLPGNTFAAPDYAAFAAVFGADAVLSAPLAVLGTARLPPCGSTGGCRTSPIRCAPSVRW